MSKFKIGDIIKLNSQLSDDFIITYLENQDYEYIFLAGLYYANIYQVTQSYDSGSIEFFRVQLFYILLRPQTIHRIH